MKTKKNINIHNISSKSPVNMEITWGQCPRVPKENGGLRTTLSDWQFDILSARAKALRFIICMQKGCLKLQLMICLQKYVFYSEISRQKDKLINWCEAQMFLATRLQASTTIFRSGWAAESLFLHVSSSGILTDSTNSEYWILDILIKLSVI